MDTIKFYKDNQDTIYDIDVFNNEKVIHFDATRVNLKGINKVFPSVQHIVLKSDIRDVLIDNKMFPNVRCITSFTPYFCNGDTLVKKCFNMKGCSMEYTLFNTFCLKEYEPLNLQNVTHIENDAFDGCETKEENISDFDSIKQCKKDAFKGSSLENIPFLFNGMILNIINEENECFSFSNKIKCIRDNIDLQNLKKLEINSFTDIDSLIHLFVNPVNYIDTLVLPEKLMNSPLFSHYRNYFLNNECLCKIPFLNIEVTNSSKFKTIDGILYKGKSLEFCSKYRTKDVIVPAGIEFISSCAFSKCQFKTIVFSDGIRIIQKYAFHNSKIETVKLNKDIEIIANSAFKDCENLSNINLAETNLKNVYDKAFFNCPKLESIELPESLETFGHEAFLSAKKIIINKYHNDIIFAVTCFDPYLYMNEKVGEKLYTEIIYKNKNNGETRISYLPMRIDKTKKFCLDWINENELTLYTYEKFAENKRMIAYEVYKKTGDKNVFKYLNRIKCNLYKDFLEKDDEKTFIECIELIKPSKKALTNLCDDISDKNWVVAKTSILSMINEETKSGFKL